MARWRTMGSALIAGLTASVALVCLTGTGSAVAVPSLVDASSPVTAQMVCNAPIGENKDHYALVNVHIASVPPNSEFYIGATLRAINAGDQLGLFYSDANGIIDSATDPRNAGEYLFPPYTPDGPITPAAGQLWDWDVYWVANGQGHSQTGSFIVQPAANCQTKYVALGDSYSAGEGIDPYFRDGYNERGVQTGSVDNRCHRSTQAYAEHVQLGQATAPFYVTASGPVTNPGTGKRINKYGSDRNVRTNGDVSWAFLACSGATTWNVLPTSKGGLTQSSSAGYRDTVPQLDNNAIDSTTTLVTVTVGGNDIDFAGVLRDCFWNACNKPAKVASHTKDIDNLQPTLVNVYSAIKQKAPNARILVLGYPQVFPASSAEQNCAKLHQWRGEQNMLRTMGTKLNNAISSAASTAGVQFVDVTSAFAGHEVCGNGGEFINGPSSTYKAKRVFVDDESFHPNVNGQNAYTAAINAVLR